MGLDDRPDVKPKKKAPAKRKGTNQRSTETCKDRLANDSVDWPGSHQLIQLHRSLFNPHFIVNDLAIEFVHSVKTPELKDAIHFDKMSPRSFGVDVPKRSDDDVGHMDEFGLDVEDNCRGLQLAFKPVTG